MIWSALALTAGVLYLLIVQQPAQWEKVSAAWRARLSDSADNRARTIEAWRAGELRHVAIVAALIPLDQSGQAVADSGVDRLLRERRLSTLFVLDSQLEVRFTQPPQSVFGPDFRTLAREVAGSGRASAEIYLDQGAIVLLACARQSGADDRRFQIACLRENVTDRVQAVLGGFPATASGEALLARAAGSGILFVSPRRFADGKFSERIESPDPRLAMVDALGGTPAVGDYLDYRNVPVLAAVRPVADTRWGVVVKIDLAEVRADYRREVREMWSVALGAGLALLAVATGVARTRRESLERARLSALARLGAVMDGASDAILLVRADGRIIEANRRAEQMYGRSRGVLRATPVSTLQGDESPPATGTDAAAGPEGEGLFEQTHRAADGRPITVEISARWLADEHAHLYVIRDVTARKRTEAALRATSDELAAVIEAAPVPIISVAPEGSIRSWNPAAERTFGWAAAEVVGRPLPFVPPDRRGESRHLLARVLAGERLEGAELRRVRKDGRPIDVRLWTAPLQVGDGSVTGTMAVMVDITERKRLREHLGLRVRLYQTLSLVNKLIVQGGDRAALFEGTCRILSAVGGFPVSWIGWKAEDGRVEVAARAGAASAYAKGLEVRWDDDPRGGGPTGTAIRERRPVVIDDVTRDPSFAPWRDRAMAHGLRSSGAFPIVTGGEAVGALMIYAAEPAALGAEERELVAEVAADLGYALDTLAHREARRTLEEQLRAIFEGDVIGMLFGDIHGRVFEANDRFLDIIGCSRDELESGAIRWDDITPPEHLPRDMAAVAEAQARGACTPYEKEYVRKDGTRVWVTVGFVLLEPGRERSVAFVLDIGDRKRAEEKLTASEALYRSLFDNMLNGFVYCRMLYEDQRPVDFEYLAANPAFEQLTGFTGVVGKRASEVIPGIRESDPELLESHGRVARTRVSESFETYVRALDMWVEVTLYSPSPDHFVSVFNVITQRKRAEAELRTLTAALERRVRERTAELEAANRELEAFTYSVSHDLRAPLRAIDGFSRMVLEDYGPALDEEARRLLGVVRDNTSKMDQLIDDLLELSRVGRREMRETAVDMGRLVRAAFDEAAGDARDRVDLRIGDLPGTAGDPSLLRQVWVNLLSNAVKFSARKDAPAIEISAWFEDGQIAYAVRDNGAGFDQRYADRLFQVFQRLHADSEFPGTGVGLAIVARVVGRHGGRVWAEGRPGEGATFYFTLPTR